MLFLNFSSLSFCFFPQIFRVLTPWTGDRSESLVRNLLLVAPIQLDLQNILLEKLPEFFDIVPETSLEDDVTRLIINHFRWLDFVVDPVAFSERLMQVLSICPLYLKKEIIGSLPEIIGDHNNKSLIDSLERMLQEDSAITVPVLDSLSSINLDAQSQDQVHFFLPVSVQFLSSFLSRHLKTG